jgi:chemotaxis protein methyltransferase CheR
VTSASDAECVAFLQWALPHLGRRWAGYRKVRRQVCRRARHRVHALGLGSLADYRTHLERHPEEWQDLDALTNITISRFHRDRGVFAFIQSEVLPILVERPRDSGSGIVRAWSAGCASGEEPYTLAIIWELEIAPRAPGIDLQILATDVEPAMLRRSREARYPASALRELRESWREAALISDDDELALLPRFRHHVSIARHDIRTDPPDGLFDLILCRYVALPTSTRPANGTRSGGSRAPVRPARRSSSAPTRTSPPASPASSLGRHGWGFSGALRCSLGGGREGRRSVVSYRSISAFHRFAYPDRRLGWKL